MKDQDDYYRYTLSCHGCAQRSRVKPMNIIAQPLNNCVPHLCPYCGHEAVVSQDTDTDYFEYLASSYTKLFRTDGIIGPDAIIEPEILKTLYDAWMPLRKYTYGTFIQRAITEPDFLDEVLAA